MFWTISLTFYFKGLRPRFLGSSDALKLSLFGTCITSGWLMIMCLAIALSRLSGKIYPCETSAWMSSSRVESWTRSFWVTAIEGFICTGVMLWLLDSILDKDTFFNKAGSDTYLLDTGVKSMKFALGSLYYESFAAVIKPNLVWRLPPNVYICFLSRAFTAFSVASVGLEVSIYSSVCCSYFAFAMSSSSPLLYSTAYLTTGFSSTGFCGWYPASSSYSS